MKQSAGERGGGGPAAGWQSTDCLTGNAALECCWWWYRGKVLRAGPGRARPHASQTCESNRAGGRAGRQAGRQAAGG